MDKIEGKGSQPAGKAKIFSRRRAGIKAGKLSTNFVKKLWKSFG
jgi:hypothetical protein